MKNRIIFIIGITGVILFTISCIIGGLLIENYSITRQYISETFAVDTKYGIMLRIFGHIPSGILFTIFSIYGYKYFSPANLTKIGFYGLGLFYGIGTIVVSIFPCDSGCNSEFVDPSTSQVIHNFTALLIYTFVPISIIITGIGLKKFPKYRNLSIIALALGILSILFVYLLISELNSNFGGLYQRIIELLILTWIITCALKIRFYPYISGSYNLYKPRP
jgi:hypothetical membrane protein